MSFLPEWWSQGVQGMDSNGGFGTANMFNKSTAGQMGDFGGYLPKLIAMLRSKGQDGQMSATPDMTAAATNAPSMSNVPSFTPYQSSPNGPNMGQINSPLQVSPNGQIMPNWNRTHGGY